MSDVCDPSGDALTFPVGAASTPPAATAGSRVKLKRSSPTEPCRPPRAGGTRRCQWKATIPRCRFLRLRALVERPQTHRPQPLRHRKPELFHDTATRSYRLHSEQPNAATVHRRFPNKTDLLIHVVESAHHELAPQPPHWRSIAEIPTGLSSSAQRACGRMLRRLYGSIGDYRELLRPIGKPRPTPIGTESGPSSNRPAKATAIPDPDLDIVHEILYAAMLTPCRTPQRHRPWARNCRTPNCRSAARRIPAETRKAQNNAQLDVAALGSGPGAFRGSQHYLR
jgi:hypothetical protein